MVAHERNNLRAHVVAVERVYVQMLKKSFSRLHPSLFMAARAYLPLFKLRRRGLAEIMAESREHHRHLLGIRQVINHLARAINDEPGMNIQVSLRVPFFLLWHADQSFQLRKKLIERAELLQPLESD